ncbi:alpha-(1,3)-fucosyltransferase C-like [Brevipalpus obovatus]|uniref:alpha-(1,3)-fucosyltransferase C-like n=1 Tax=Brevipalpus obovatus TaxID=246614 RepID=UPI003D9E65CC
MVKLNDTNFGIDPLIDHIMSILMSYFHKLRRKNKRKCAILLLVTIALITGLYFLDDNTMIFTRVQLSKEPVIYLHHEPKIILLWTPFFGSKDWSNQNLIGYRNSCSCLITRDRSYLPHASAVIFHWRDVGARDLPIKYTNQKWIFFLVEPPPYTRRYFFLSKISPHFDCSATYRQDSDFPTTYGCKYDLVPSDYQFHHVPVKNKRLAAWLASDCDVISKREEYVQQLKQYMPVDVYGKCGENCDNKMVPCHQFIGENYLFYLAFENSVCKDYYTEKVVAKLQQDIVPVVMGGANYSQVLPTNSYIDIADFDSPQSLAEFLWTLSHDEKRYNSYFAWKSDPQFRSSKHCGDQWCRVCDKLADPKAKCQHESGGFVDWWQTKANCRSWYEIVPKSRRK